VQVVLYRQTKVCMCQAMACSETVLGCAGSTCHSGQCTPQIDLAVAEACAHDGFWFMVIDEQACVVHAFVCWDRLVQRAGNRSGHPITGARSSADAQTALTADDRASKRMPPGSLRNSIVANAPMGALSCHERKCCENVHTQDAPALKDCSG
jgi:hypothetical protein